MWYDLSSRRYCVIQQNYYFIIIQCYINLKYCSACDDNCTGILLDIIVKISQELAAGTGHIADGYIPPPWVELTYIDSNVTVYFEELELRSRLRQRMKNVPWHKYKKLMKDVEILLRNVCYVSYHKTVPLKIPLFI